MNLQTGSLAISEDQDEMPMLHTGLDKHNFSA